MPGTPGVHAGRRSLLLLALLATITSPAFATRWDPVSPEDLASGRPGQDPAAGAVVLFSRVWVDDEVDGDDLRSVWVHYVRIKVLTAEAAQELASQQIRFEDHSRVTEVEARTIQPDGRVTPMPPQAVSKETRARVRGRKFKSIRFAPPEIRAGCIVEYRWRQVFDDALLHYATFDLQMEDLPAREIRIHLKPLVIPRWAQRQMTFGTLKPSTRDEGGYFVWEQRDVPGFHEEPFMPPERHVRPWLMVAYVPSARRSGTHYWAERGKEGAEFFDDWCRSGDALREVAREVTAGASNDLERLERLARWCRAEFHAHVPDRDTLRAHHVKPNANASAALRQRAGTLQDLDLLFAALARCAGFEVRYAAVPDRRDVRFTQALTEAAFLSSYQVAVRVDGGWRSFDPQGRWLPWDMVPIEEEGQLSLVCDRDSTFFLETPIAEPERSARARLADLELEEDGDLVGSLEPGVARRARGRPGHARRPAPAPRVGPRRPRTDPVPLAPRPGRARRVRGRGARPAARPRRGGRGPAAGPALGLVVHAARAVHGGAPALPCPVRLRLDGHGFDPHPTARGLEGGDVAGRPAGRRGGRRQLPARVRARGRGRFDPCRPALPDGARGESRLPPGLL